MVIRAAFATSDGKETDRHFGAAERFDIYEIHEETKKIRYIETRQVTSACQKHSHNAASMEEVLRAVNDCHVVFAACAGERAKEALAERQVQVIELEYPVETVLDRLINAKVKLVDSSGWEKKAPLPSQSQKKQDAFRHLKKRHPCMGQDANVQFGRIHLPVSPTCNIQCRFCTRCFDKTEIKPGVSSLILKPAEAIKTIEKAMKLCPTLSVVGIAGPGDTLATDDALDTFAMVKKEFPQLICCLSTNGFRLADKIERIKEIGIETLTVTVNAVDPEIEQQINAFVIDENGRKTEGLKAAELLIEKQKLGIQMAAAAGIVVKINSVLIPGVNDKHIKEVARVTAKLGASILNIIPLIPQNEMADREAPTCEMLEKVRQEAGVYLEVFRHCRHCRADACGIPGKGEDLHSKLYEKEVVERFSHG